MPGQESSNNHAESEGLGSVYVQHSAGKDTMTISLEYSTSGKIKSFNLYRKAHEPLAASFERLKLNISKLNKMKKPKNGAEEPSTKQEGPLNVSILVNGTSLDPEVTNNIDAWIEGATLDLNGKQYVIKRNEPQVVIMKLPSIIMRGFTTIPTVDVANCIVNTCKFVWYRQISAQERVDLMSKDESLKSKIELRQQTYWLPVSTGISYVPTDDDVAHLLSLVCHPSDGTKVGPMFYCISGGPVELGPPMCPFEKRQAHTIERMPKSDRFRFVSYNILADLYANQEYSRSVLFAHCPPHALEIDYRRQLLLKEIHGYQADIVCLQEVDKREFIKAYEPYFKLVCGYQGAFDTKGGQVAEGVATFFREDRFELIDTHRTILSQLIDPCASMDNKEEEMDEAVPIVKKDVGDSAKDNSDASSLYNQASAHPILGDLKSETAQKLLAQVENIRSAIQSNPALYKRFMSRHTIIQTNLLKLKDMAGKYVIVANTHLYFAPDADHVRLLQGSVCVKYLEFAKEFYKTLIETRQNERDPKISIIFCGDMNSTPDCGLFKLVVDGKVTDAIPDWRSNEKEAVKGLSVETHLRFSSAYRDLNYTNYTPGFNGWLDHIYYELDGIECESTVPMPDHKDVIATEGIPSDVFPSDHLALIVNLSLRS